MTSSTGFRTIVLTLVLFAFVAGASAGVAGNRLLAPRVVLRTPIDEMSRVFDRLRLTPEQRRQAEPIVAASTPRTRAVMIELGERLRQVADSVDAELRAILTPEQRARLDSLRSDSRLLLKRKVTTPGGTEVDTILDTTTKRRRP